MLNVTLRSLNPETDYSALTQLYRAVEQAAGMEPSTTAESLRLRTWGTRWVAEDASQLDFFPAAGWMASQSPTRFFVYAVVHPAWRRQGPGSQMLAYVGPGKPILPPGYTIRPYAEIPDLALLAQAQNRCFTDRWGHFENLQQTTPEQLNR